MRYEIELHPNLVFCLESRARRLGTTVALIVQLAIAQYLVRVEPSSLADAALKEGRDRPAFGAE